MADIKIVHSNLIIADKNLHLHIAVHRQRLHNHLSQEFMIKNYTVLSLQNSVHLEQLHPSHAGSETTFESFMICDVLYKLIFNIIVLL